MAADDILLFWMEKENSAAVTAAPGFAVLLESNTASVWSKLYWKRTNGTETDLTFDWTGNTYAAGVLVAISGAHTTLDPVAGAGNPQAGSSTTVSCLSVTPSEVDNLLVALGSTFSDRTWTAPTGMTKRTVILSVIERNIGMADLALVTADATGNKDFTLSSADTHRNGVLVLIRPTTAGAGPTDGELALATSQLFVHERHAYRIVQY
jgi:hypothetical protein